MLKWISNKYILINLSKQAAASGVVTLRPSPPI